MLLNEEHQDSHSFNNSLRSSKSNLDDLYHSFSSRPSYHSFREYATSDNNNTFKYTYTIISILNSLIGIFTIYRHYPDLIKNSLNLFIYLVSYTFLWPITIILALIFSLVAYIFVQFFNKGEEDRLTYNYYSFLVIITIINLVSFYLIAIPTSIKALYYMVNSNYFYDYRNYLELYLFIILNLIKSIVINFVAIYLIFKNKFMSKRLKLELDQEFIQQIQMEVEYANKFSGVIAPDSKLIKMNSMFNRQYYSPDNENEKKKSELNINSDINLQLFKKEMSINMSDMQLNMNNFRGSMEEKKTQIKTFLKQQTLNSNSTANNNKINNFKTQLLKNKNSDLSPNAYNTQNAQNTPNIKNKMSNGSIFNIELEYERKSNLSEDMKSKNSKTQFRDDMSILNKSKILFD